MAEVLFNDEGGGEGTLGGGRSTGWRVGERRTLGGEEMIREPEPLCREGGGEKERRWGVGNLGASFEATNW